MENLRNFVLQPAWKRRRLESFLTAVAAADTEPPWGILHAPRIPEHIIACYLCALGEVPPAEDWQAGFVEEVEYLGSEGISDLISWEKHRADGEALRSTLLAAGNVVVGRL